MSPEQFVCGQVTSKASRGVRRELGAKPTGLPLSGSVANNATLNSSMSISPDPSQSHMRKYLSAFQDAVCITAAVACHADECWRTYVAKWRDDEEEEEEDDTSGWAMGGQS